MSSEGVMHDNETVQIIFDGRPLVGFTNDDIQNFNATPVYDETTTQGLGKNGSKKRRTFKQTDITLDAIDVAGALVDLKATIEARTLARLPYSLIIVHTTTYPPTVVPRVRSATYRECTPNFIRSSSVASESSVQVSAHSGVPPIYSPPPST